MQPSLATRKPVDALSPEDFATFPIWEFATDEEGVEGQDETWVRPVDARAIPRNAYSLSVGARVVLANGRIVTGMCQVSTAGAVEVELVVVLVPGHYVFIPKSSEAGTGPMRRLLEVLGLSGAQEFFPARFELNVPVEGELSARSGVLT